MCIRIMSLALVVAFMVFGTYAADYTKLVFKDCGSKGVEIQEVDMRPMPIINPGDAWFTFKAKLLRPLRVLETTLNIIRTVSGITLPVKCYIVNGKPVGSCTYKDLCQFLQDNVNELQPGKCPENLAEYGIDCTCPFKIVPQQLNIIDQFLALPDASQTAATFLASGNFNITVIAKDLDNPSAQQPYGCGIALVTIKKK